MDSKKNKKSPKFECFKCGTKTNNKKDYAKHLMTAKHAKNVNGDGGDKNFPHFQCEKCNKNYESRNGLWKHSKMCNYIKDLPIQNEIINIESNENIIMSINETDAEPKDTNLIKFLFKENTDFKNMILEVVKSNTDLQKQNNELQKQVLEVCKNTSITNINNSNNNSHNKTFNLQFFLNEQCKDAMNISDFVNSFELQLSDLESVGELGYVDGITKIMLDKLNAMDIYKRPVHCSDTKREILYVKDADKWEKELRSNPKLRHAIKTVSFKNMKLAVLWSDTYPESKASESRLNDVYMKLIIQSTGGSGEIGDSENKIIKRIAKEIFIDKNSDKFKVMHL